MTHVRIPLFASLLALTLFACGGSQSADHGTITGMSAVHNAELCEHEVPAEVCTRCHPELEAGFRAANDWCGPHSIPESQCHRCHPDLNFDPLPELAPDADMHDLSTEEALEGLAAHAVPGKVTVFDFSAAWCAPCRNLEAHLRTRLGTDDALAVRKIDVGDWEGPVVDRYMSDVAGLPYVIVFGPNGERVGDMSQFEPAEIDTLIDEAAGQ